MTQEINYLNRANGQPNDGINEMVRANWPDLVGQSFSGIITRGVGGNYNVRLSDGRQLVAVPRGFFARQVIPHSGDHVVCSLTNDPDVPARIDDIKKKCWFGLLGQPDYLILTFSVTSCSRYYFN